MVRGSFAAVVAIACVLAGCPPPPQPSPSPLDQTIIIRSNFVPRFFANVNSTHYSWQWGQQAMSNVPSIALSGSNRIDALFNVAGVNVQNNLSVLAVFARDPREVTDVLDSSNSRIDWRSAYSNWALPRVRFVFPPGGPPPAAVGGPWVTSHFFPGCQTGVVGPGADPGGFGSIKSIRTSRRGQCSTMVRINPIVDDIMTGVQEGLVNKDVTSAPSCTDVNQDSFDGLSYLTHQSVDLPDSGPSGGFALLFQGDYHHFIPFVSNFTFFSFNYRYELRLVDGRLGANPLRNNLQTSGFKDGDAFTALADALDNKIPTSILDRAGEQQAMAPPIPNSPNIGPCTADSDCGGAHFACLPSVDPKNAPGRFCRELLFGVCDQVTDPTTGMLTENILDGNNKCIIGQGRATNIVKAGAVKLGLSAGDAAILAATANQIVNGSFANWRCQQPTHGRNDASEKFRCQYVVKAKRLNVYPQDAELVWFDEVELTNPAFAAYAALFNIAEQDKLCTAGFDDLGDAHLARGNYVREAQDFKKLYLAPYRDNLSCLLNNFGFFKLDIVLGKIGLILGAGFLPWP